MLRVFRKVVNLILFNSFFFFFLFIKIMCIKIKSSWYFEELNLLMKSKQGFLYFLIIINSLIFYNALILKWGFHIKKMNLREHQNIHNRYIQHTYAVLHKVLSKLMVSTHSYLMVCVGIVKDARCIRYIKWISNKSHTRKPYLRLLLAWQYTEEAVCRCFTKKVFLEISQISQETPVPEPLFDKVVLK